MFLWTGTGTGVGGNLLAPKCASFRFVGAGGSWEGLEGQQGTSRVPSGTSGVALGRATGGGESELEG